MHSQRKRDHLRICLEEDVASRAATGLERVHLRHCALPDMDLDAVDLSTTFLGHSLRAPLLISAMTGGAGETEAINRRLAKAAQRYGLAMGLGSQRSGLHDAALMRSYQVRDAAPDILLFGNLGVAQLGHPQGLDDALRAVEAVDADALVIHLNPLQEALQPEGDRDFSGLLDRISELCALASKPVIAKEVGWGISGQVANELVKTGVSAIDVAGAGGTSWGRVERFRTDTEIDVLVAEAFDDWGIPTAEAVRQVRAACPDVPLIASGGLGTGVDVLKCLALGASLGGMAMPLLAAAVESQAALNAAITVVLRQLRIAMFCAGAARVADITSDLVMEDAV